MPGLLGSAVAKADTAAGAPRRLRGLPPAKSEAVYACAMVLRQAVTRHEKEGGGLGEAQTLFTAPEVRPAPSPIHTTLRVPGGPMAVGLRLAAGRGGAPHR